MHYKHYGDSGSSPERKETELLLGDQAVARGAWKRAYGS